MDGFPAAVEQYAGDAPMQGSRKQRSYAILCAFLALISAALIVYSQTRAFVWDEGFHLVAAQLIDSGKRPYIDFCFPQTPLNAYLNAAIMYLFGPTWQIVHFFAALFTIGAVILTADFVFTHFPVARWRLACAIVAALFVATSTIVLEFCEVGQAYGIGLFFIVAAFRSAVLTIDRRNVFLPLATGLLASIAAASSLLTAPVLPVLLAWILFYDKTDRRWLKSIAFIIGAAIPFIPVFWLFAQAPRQTFFNVVTYQMMFRRVNWTGATPHDIDALSGWLNSSQALIIGFLAIVGVVFIAKFSDWDQRRRAKFYLAGWLAAGLTAYIATAHPTFERYFLFVTPFLAILACPGLYFAAARLASAERPRGPALLVSVLLCLAIGRGLFLDRNSVKWPDYYAISKKVRQVTPRGGVIYADELVYFVLNQQPPPGMEFSYSHKLDLPPKEAAPYHIVSERELKREFAAGKFDTAENCDDDEIDRLGLTKAFAKRTDIRDCTVFWDPVAKHH